MYKYIFIGFGEIGYLTINRYRRLYLCTVHSVDYRARMMDERTDATSGFFLSVRALCRGWGALIYPIDYREITITDKQRQCYNAGKNRYNEPFLVDFVLNLRRNETAVSAFVVRVSINILKYDATRAKRKQSYRVREFRDFRPGAAALRLTFNIEMLNFTTKNTSFFCFL